MRRILQERLRALAHRAPEGQFVLRALRGFKTASGRGPVAAGSVGSGSAGAAGEGAVALGAVCRAFARCT